jgi:hypothetical protein
LSCDPISLSSARLFPCNCSKVYIFFLERVRGEFPPAEYAMQ